MRKTAGATANDPDDSTDDDATDGDTVDDTCAAAKSVLMLMDCCQDDDVAADGSARGYDDDANDYDDDDLTDGDDDFADDTVVGDEDANVAATVFGGIVAEDGREPLPLLIRALPLRGLLAFLFLPKQVRGPVREVEESEYDWEEDPRDDVDALGPRRELGQPRPAAVFFPWLHMYFARPHFIHRHGILRVSYQRLLKEFGRY